jgi:prolyl-tRNA synthetase
MARLRGKEVVDIRLATTGDPCPSCDGGQAHAYKRHRGGPHLHPRHEVLGGDGRHYIDEKQQTKPLVMGCYGIGVSRLVATTIEQHNDENGIRWPMSPIAPYHVHLVHHRQGRGRARPRAKLYDAL